jgi:uncharacterized protein (TIGR03083 family)
MEYADLLVAFRREGAAFDEAVRAAGLDAEVPSCPGWNVNDLCAHLARVHRWAAEIVEARPDEPAGHWKRLRAPVGPDVFDFVDAGIAELGGALDRADPAEPCWSWTDDRTVRFWARRQAHELAIHRWDAQCAAGRPEPIEHGQAVDSIQELFDIRPFRPGGVTPGHGETVHLHCTDGEGEWLARFEPDRAVVTHEHAKGDAAARGTASDLLLLMWGRIPVDRVEVFGDASLLASWRDGMR